MKRASGVLMPIFSLDNEFGIGDFGKCSYDFINLLKKSGQTVWQILPLVQTGYGNSPYSSVCSTSFNPYFISPELLKKDGLLTRAETEFVKMNKSRIDYAELYSVRFPMLERAFSRFDKNNTEFQSYVKSKESYDYALFMTLKYASGQKHFYEWEECYKFRDKTALKIFNKDYSDKILFWQFVQFTAKKQWLAVKKYANDNGIKILGDIPLYVALDSVDVWQNPKLYKLDQNLNPKKVAGVPPDYFCADGQLWGNPVYNYSEHQKDNFKWWVKRIKNALKIYDLVRIDHFRGLDRYYEIDKDQTTARFGTWVDVPSDDLFYQVNKNIKRGSIIAEDLGIIDDGVRQLLDKTGYPGMKILSFAFNGDKNNLYLPENLPENCVCYTGTHDNDTLKGLIESFNDWDYTNFISGLKNSLEIMDIKGSLSTIDGIIQAVIECGMKSKADLFMVPLQDLLKVSKDYRINTPGSVDACNWSIKFNKEQIKKALTPKLRQLTIKYKR